MPVQYLDNGMVFIDYQMGDPPLIFSDALIMTVEEYNSLTPEQLLAMEQERYNNWLAVINGQPPIESQG